MFLQQNSFQQSSIMQVFLFFIYGSMLFICGSVCFAAEQLSALVHAGEPHSPHHTASRGWRLPTRHQTLPAGHEATHDEAGWVTAVLKKVSAFNRKVKIASLLDFTEGGKMPQTPTTFSFWWGLSSRLELKTCCCFYVSMKIKACAALHFLPVYESINSNNRNLWEDFEDLCKLKFWHLCFFWLFFVCILLNPFLFHHLFIYLFITV